ncbi:something about silencing, SAS, complex subunit 4-domain-containing protein [Massariosphaeria phaeospora]|uniref:Something about silencing, SAS, complex subunit 4-domain-containing protein n=1 Tax=Massariosphaeria phaeospora TaxID=100035 RepID=A0A7C8ID27_9PLEO|nr:something about silencing, SAS, complex subunit 4-domain-containing protein [Massariosphaeria phaeospora]
MMANPTRPPLTRHTKSPTDEIENGAQPPNAPLSTRRSSRSTPLRSLGDQKAARALRATPAKPARTSSRKRPATAAALVADALPNTRPPTKVTVTQPHGELLAVTNGVAKPPLGIADDDVASGRSTPRPNGAAALAVPGSAAGTQAHAQDKRSLRSQDGGSRLKSDLPIYFANYDDVIAGVPRTADFLELNTPIYIVDEPPKKPHDQEPSEASRKSASPSRARQLQAHTPPRSPSDPARLAQQSSIAFQVLDYSAITRHLRNDDQEDPLADSVYFAQHRRAERKEKQLRNIEKERAMHEKVQLERLLDGLQGPDWLKVMGITGVTDGERRDWEPKRDYFVREVEALVDKFRIWKEEEKRLRAVKEAALAALEDEDEEEESSVSNITNTLSAERSTSQHRRKDIEPPRPRRPPRPHGFVLPPVPLEPQSPFKSFYAKPHLRAAALGKHRHGRNATAFGLPIPDFHEHDFELPQEFVSANTLRDNARKRRRVKRESKS